MVYTVVSCSTWGAQVWVLEVFLLRMTPKLLLRMTPNNRKYYKRPFALGCQMRVGAPCVSHCLLSDVLQWYRSSVHCTTESGRADPQLLAQTVHHSS
jgi:hypothetical protein